MTESEAIEAIQFDLKIGGEIHSKVLRDAVDVAIQALEKQIAKKPTYDGDGYAPDGTFVWDEWICPCCGTRYEVDYDEHDFCPNCGQKIDWSDEE